VNRNGVWPLYILSFDTKNISRRGTFPSFPFLTYLLYFEKEMKLTIYLFDHIVTCMSDYRWGFGLEIGFIDHFNTRLMTTLNYSAIADLHTLQITRASLSLFQPAVCSPLVSWQRISTQ
jgi:hypothetical protein